MKPYNITIVCNKNSWMSAYADKLANKLEQNGHNVHICLDIGQIKQGDFAFYLSCEQIASADILVLNKHNLVVHPSELPKGRGWSPLAWQILEGQDEIYVTLFEANVKVDSGDIYLQEKMRFQGHELADELHVKQGEITIRMCLNFLNKYPKIISKRRKQIGESSYYDRRSPKDNMLDVDQSIAKQFNIFRIVDNDKYPAYFRYRGHKYVLQIKKDDDFDK